MPQIQTGYVLVASIIAAVMGVAGIATIQNASRPIDILLMPESATYVVGDVFMVSVIARSNEPVNVFSGNISFNQKVLSVERIDYNTSIADLWAVEPWYVNGDGTIGFAGGTTQQGGFVGEDTLVTITFRANDIGSASLHLSEERILKHDGLGTDAETMEAPIDALFTIEPERLESETLAKESGEENNITVLSEPQTTDLNGDGLHTFKDISIFMVQMSTQNVQSDFNGDETVNTADLSILLEAL